MARHPETDLYRCRHRTHAFSHLDSVKEFEQYQSDYFEEEHKRWFENPNTALLRQIASVIPSGASFSTWAAVKAIFCGTWTASGLTCASAAST